MTRLEDIGSALVDARVARHLTQRELAAQLGVHQQQIARWERERYGCVSLARLTKVAAALGLGGSAVLFNADGQNAQQPLLAAEEQAGYGTVTLEAPDVPEVPEVTPVRDLGEIVARIRDHADELHETYGVTRIDVFGSFARGEQRPDSDVDLIVEVAEPRLETVFGAQERLGEILGRRTEAGSFRGINPRGRGSVEEDLVHVWSTERDSLRG